MSAASKWLKRLLLLFVIAVAAVGVALYALYFRRAPLPPAASHALVTPSVASLPGLSACWIETGKTFSNFSFGSTAGSILVRHPAGDLLIDTGNSSHFDDEIRSYPFRTWLKLRFLAGQLKPDVPLSEMLRRVKEDPAKLRWVILSHAHLDHSGGLMDLPRLPVLLLQEELQFAADASVQAKGYVIAAYVQKFPEPDAPTLRLQPQPYETPTGASSTWATPSTTSAASRSVSASPRFCETATTMKRSPIELSPGLTTCTKSCRSWRSSPRMDAARIKSSFPAAR